MSETVVPEGVVPVAAHKTETLGGSAFSPTGMPNQAKYLLVQALAQNARYTLDGTAPSATVGFQLKSTDTPILIAIGKGMVPAFFREQSGTILQYCWMGDAT